MFPKFSAVSSLSVTSPGSRTDVISLVCRSPFSLRAVIVIASLSPYLLLGRLHEYTDFLKFTFRHAPADSGPNISSIFCRCSCFFATIPLSSAYCSPDVVDDPILFYFFRVLLCRLRI